MNADRIVKGRLQNRNAGPIQLGLHLCFSCIIYDGRGPLKTHSRGVLYLCEGPCHQGVPTRCTSKELPTCNGHNKGFGIGTNTPIDRALHLVQKHIENLAMQ